MVPRVKILIEEKCHWGIERRAIEMVERTVHGNSSTACSINLSFGKSRDQYIIHLFECSDRCQMHFASGIEHFRFFGKFLRF